MKKHLRSSLEPGTQSRRRFISTIAGVPVAMGLPPGFMSAVANTSSQLPAKEDFDIQGTYLNAAYTHPLTKGSAQSIRTYLDERLANGRAPGYDMGKDRKEALASFAKMINATPEEIAWIPSTMVGENLVVSGLGLRGSKERVVTDAYHFHGSLHLYGQLAHDGLDVAVVRPRENRIDLGHLAKAITPGTKLVALSLVSATTGFQHDLTKVCEIAHERGALVYADIIQAAGAGPINLQESKVDFCACATYKWLMGDFGVGFLYVRKDRLDLLKRSQIGYRQMASFTSHVLPFDPPGENVFDSAAKDDTAGHFEVGTLGNEGVAALRYSLDYLNKIGIERIQQHRMPMIQALQGEIPKYGHTLLTPSGSTSPIVSFAMKDADKILKPRLVTAGVNIQTYENMFRVSPSFYNDMDDIEKLLNVIASTR